MVHRGKSQENQRCQPSLLNCWTHGNNKCLFQQDWSEKKNPLFIKNKKQKLELSERVWVRGITKTVVLIQFCAKNGRLLILHPRRVPWEMDRGGGPVAWRSVQRDGPALLRKDRQSRPSSHQKRPSLCIHSLCPLPGQRKESRLVGSVSLDTALPQQPFLRWTLPFNSSGYIWTTRSGTLDTKAGISLLGQDASDGMIQRAPRTRGDWEGCFSVPALYGICQECK